MSDVPAQQGQGGHESHAHVTVFVDDVKKEVRPGAWLVREFKSAVGADQAKVLAEITPHGLKDLDDDSKIAVHEGQRFMTHARSGGSS